MVRGERDVKVLVKKEKDPLCKHLIKGLRTNVLGGHSIKRLLAPVLTVERIHCLPVPGHYSQENIAIKGSVQQFST